MKKQGSIKGQILGSYHHTDADEGQSEEIFIVFCSLDKLLIERDLTVGLFMFYC